MRQGRSETNGAPAVAASEDETGPPPTGETSRTGRDGTDPTAAIAYETVGETYRFPIEFGSGQSVSTAVALAVSTVADADHTDITPLASTVDPDALDRLFDRIERGQPRTVVFSHAGYRVSIDGAGWIDVTPEHPESV
ncbi:MAG: HalOD1 output domain-containing protein [Halobacteriota archaeon]